MKFKLPENLSALGVDELKKLSAEALAESADLSKIPDAELTDEQLESLEALAAAVVEINAASAELQRVAQERADRLAAAREKLSEASAPAEDHEEQPDGGEDEGDENEDDKDGEPVVVPDDASELINAEEKELVTASARRSVIKDAANHTEPDLPEPVGSVLVAAANLPSVSAGDAFTDLTEAARVFGQRASKGPAAGSKFEVADGASYGLSDNATRLGFMKIQKPELEFAAHDGMSAAKQMELINAAGSESRLQGGSLLAAGGWCAPSETDYGFCSF